MKGRIIKMEQAQIKELKKIACKVRMHVIEGTFNAKSGHPGGSMSITDMLTYLYFKQMRIDPENPKMENRDRFVLSKGHCAPALYGVLAERGFFPTEEIKKLRKIGAFLQGHPEMKNTPGVDMSTGSLGQGISAACGMALSGKLFNNDYRVYVVLGDGESQEGEVWEALMFAAHYKLDNLCIILDNNGLQIDGTVDEVMSLGNIKDKLTAFGHNVIEIDGHDFNQIEQAHKKAETVKGKPTVILQKSVKGKGISFMENQVSWHGAAPNPEQYELAMSELRSELERLEA